MFILPLVLNTQQSNTPHHVVRYHGSDESSCWNTKDWQKVAFSPSTHPDKVRFFFSCMTSLIWISFCCWLNFADKEKRKRKTSKKMQEKKELPENVNQLMKYLYAFLSAVNPLKDWWLSTTSANQILWNVSYYLNRKCSINLTASFKIFLKIHEMIQ